MYKPPGAKPASHKKATDQHIVTIEPNGQVIWNTTFHTSGIIAKDNTTYGMCWEIPNERQLMMTFASDDEMKADNEDFNSAKLDSSTFSLTNGALKKGLTSALNNCTPGISIIPGEGGRSKFEEGKNLLVDKENKCITMDYSNKKSYSEISKSTLQSRATKKLISKWLESYYMDKEAFITAIATDDDWTKEGKKTTKKGKVSIGQSSQESFWEHVKMLDEIGVYSTSTGHLDLDLIMNVLRFIPEDKREELKKTLENKED